MKLLIFIFSVIIAVMIGFHVVLQNGSFLKYLDEHPDPDWVPPTEYYVGQGYYLFHNLDDAATYFVRIPAKYPHSTYADNAYWNYVQALDDIPSTSRATIIDECNNYIAQFPNGAHVQLAQNKIDAYKLEGR